jgi:tRNA (cytidine32/uridine32-2'-O)-methyltransferase
MPAQILPPPGGIRLENIAFVLVNPKNPGNVGGVARAIKNMGFQDLRMVNPRPVNWLDAINMACGAEDLLEEARIETSLADALSDIQWVVGTTARRRRYQKNISSPQEIAQAAVSISRENKIAFLFGSEKFGLTTEEMSFCHQAVTIPTQEGFCSLNLSQAVMVIAWELFRIQEDPFSHQPIHQPSHPRLSHPPQPKLACQGELQDLFVHLGQVLKEIEFITQDNTRHMMLLLKEMIYQKALTSKEVTILRGIFRQVQRLGSLSTSNSSTGNSSTGNSSTGNSSTGNSSTGNSSTSNSSTNHSSTSHDEISNNST